MAKNSYYNNIHQSNQQPQRDQASTAVAEVPDERFLTLAEVGRMVGRSATTVGRWCLDGLLDCVRLPSGLRAVRRSEVMKFIGNSALAKQIENKGK